MRNLDSTLISTPSAPISRQLKVPDPVSPLRLCVMLLKETTTKSLLPPMMHAIMTAAQWSLWDGQALFEASRSWRGKDVTKKKWQSWKQEFVHAASSGQFGEECRVVATKAVERMDALDGQTLALSIPAKT